MNVLSGLSPLGLDPLQEGTAGARHPVHLAGREAGARPAQISRGSWKLLCLRPTPPSWAIANKGGAGERGEEDAESRSAGLRLPGAARAGPWSLWAVTSTPAWLDTTITLTGTLLSLEAVISECPAPALTLGMNHGMAGACWGWEGQSSAGCRDWEGNELLGGRCGWLCSRTAPLSYLPPPQKT